MHRGISEGGGGSNWEESDEHSEPVEPELTSDSELEMAMACEWQDTRRV